ncbi:hypothetical protein MPSEU_001046400 [Mayamaea pseudoterrestris]|nr:hypothetical protein MPSEU_001046400 [Mayamaea pseudoterrestris]
MTMTANNKITAAAVLSLVMLSSTIASGQETGSLAGSCQLTSESVSSFHALFHADSVCDRNAYTDFKNSLNRGAKHRSFKESGDHASVPNERTRVCPRVVKDLGSATTGTVYGYDTTWFLKNEASTPVVVALVKDGVEYSGVNDKISPPQADANAIVQPGGTKVIHTFEGHVFSVRSMHEDGSTGNVLLQHRAGLIPVGTHAQQLACPSTDPEPVIEVQTPATPSSPSEVKIVTHPDFARVPVKQFKQCNMLELGFRNQANCPLHAYWVHPNTCQERFTYHLGTNHQAADYQWDWDSATKFEATFVGHQFVFRSAFSAQEVDRVTILPTVVTDCPDVGEQVYEATYGLNVVERVLGLEGINVTRQEDEFVVDGASGIWSKDMFDGLLGDKQNATAASMMYASVGSMLSF